MSDSSKPKISYSSAERLHQILQKAVAHRENAPARTIWADVFGVPEQKRAEIFRHLALLADLVDQVEKDIRAIPGINHGLYLNFLNSVRLVVNSDNLLTSWPQHLENLPDAIVQGVAFCADRLKMEGAEYQLSKDTLDELSEQLRELFEEVRDGDLDPELRDVLLRLLEAARRAIADYFIRGSEGLADSLRPLVAVLWAEEQAKSPASRTPVFKKLLAWTTSLYGALKVVGSFKEGIRYLLPASMKHLADILPDP